MPEHGRCSHVLISKTTSAAPPPQILFEETLFQNASDGTPFVKMLQDKGIIPGIKVGAGGCCPASRGQGGLLPSLPDCACAPGVVGVQVGWARASPGIRINVWQTRRETCNASTQCILAGPHGLNRCTAAHSPSTLLHTHLSRWHAPTPPSFTQVDKGVVALPGTDGETETQGIDDLGKR